MANDYIIIAYYTDPGYAEYAYGLQESITKYNLQSDICEVPCHGTWLKNIGYKPHFIKQKMYEYTDKCILYLDADARICQYPKLFDTIDCDIAVHYHRQVELLSGTIWLNNKQKSREVVDNWINIQDTDGGWDQRTLAKTLRQMKDVKLHELPPSYTQIFDLMAHNGKPVIEHLQASRKLKGAVGCYPRYQKN